MNGAEARPAVVIGAGVIGAAIAMELARSGRSVTIVDREAGPGSGSTSASSAIVRFNYSTIAGTTMAWESLHAWRAWSAHVGLEEGSMLTRFVECGIVLIDTPEQVIEPTIAPLADVGVPHEIWGGEELANRLPGIDPASFSPPARAGDEAFWHEPAGSISRAVWTPNGGYVSDPQLAAQNLHEAAAQAGAVSRFGETVVAIDRDGTSTTGVTLGSGEHLEAGVVVNATGPHSSLVNLLAGVAHEMRIGTRPLRQQVDFVPSAPTGTELPIVGDLDAGLYFRPDGPGILIGGVEAECDPMVWLNDPDDVDHRLDADEWETKVLRLSRRVPEVGVPHERRGVVGVYDVSDDWIPVLDRTSLDGFYVACGTSGNQFKNAPTIGHSMRELIDAIESGHDHDAEPVVVTGRATGLPIDMGTFSRNREGGGSTGTVIG